MFRAYLIPPSKFLFGNSRTGSDKFRGLLEHGPFMSPVGGTLRFGFVFPIELRNLANDLYVALKNGIGYFRGIENSFRLRFERQSVFPITSFSIKPGLSSEASARIYTDAIGDWLTRNAERPDLLFVLHAHTAEWERGSPYYACKAVLLQHGILSQSVTPELIHDRSRFEWSAGNIALAAFVKLGGVPWVIAGDVSDDHLVLGVGRANLFDPLTRSNSARVGFTCCFSTRGVFKFVAMATVAENRTQYLQMLHKLITDSVTTAASSGAPAMSLTLHLPKELSREENSVIVAAVQTFGTVALPRVSVVKVVDEEETFALDPRGDGLPPRGLVIQIADRNYLLYTEGREERQSWRGRLPTVLRVTPQTRIRTPGELTETVRIVNDLSQLNWRGFNARSRPITILYGNRIAKLLGRFSPDTMRLLQVGIARQTLEHRMWFI